MNKYILITAARDEQDFIENTIKAVKCQTILPKQWIIALNGTKDNTVNVIRKYLNEMPFISIVNIKEDTKPAFSRKAHAIMYSYRMVQLKDISFIGVLDADVTFSTDFFECLIKKFANNPLLGLASGDLFEIQKDGKYKFIKQPREYTVSGNIQFFRKICFEDIKGYREVQSGGIDTIAAVMARMSGWKTLTFSDIHFYHHRIMGTKYSTIFKAHYKEGLRDNKMGMHFIYAFLKAIFRIKRRPVLIGSFFWIIGYLHGIIKGKEKNITQEFINYLQKEQLEYLSKKFNRHSNEKNFLLITNKAFSEDPRPQRHISALLENGYKVDVITYSDKSNKYNQLPNLNFFQFPIPRTRRNIFSYAFEYLSYFVYCFIMSSILCIIKRYKVIQILIFPEFMTLSILIPKLLGSKILVDWIDPMYEVYLSKYPKIKMDLLAYLISKCEKLVPIIANGVILPNIGFCRSFENRNIKTDQFIIVMNSADDKIFKVKDMMKSTECFNILWNGTISKRNGLDVLIEAFKICRKRINDIKLTILGYGPDENILFKSIEPVELNQSINFVGKVHLEQVAEYIGNSDLGIISNRKTAFTDINLPTRIFEFGIMRKPVIASSLPGIRDYFDDSCILFFPPDNSSELADRIMELYTNRDILTNFINSLYTRCNELSWCRFKGTYLNTINQLYQGKDLISN